jgi:hypothetical protein
MIVLLRGLLIDRSDRVHVLPVAKGAAKNVESHTSTIGDSIAVFLGKNFQDITLQRPGAQLVAILSGSAPFPDPIIYFGEDGRVDLVAGICVLVAKALDHQPKIPRAVEPEIAGIEVLVKIVPSRGSDDICYLARVGGPDSLALFLELPIIPEHGLTVRDAEDVIKGSLLQRLDGWGEDAGGICGHVYVEAHVWLGDLLSD